MPGRTRQKPKSDKITHDAFTALLKSETGADFVMEHRFHPVRRWRFDYASPDIKVAVEIDGGVFRYGRHNHPTGYISDMEKLDEAASMGWLVLRFITDDKFKRSTIDTIRRTVEYRRNENMFENKTLNT